MTNKDTLPSDNLTSDSLHSEQSDGTLKEYKISVIRYGHTFISATSPEEAISIVNEMSEDKIKWLNQDDGLSGPFIISLVELIPHGPKN